MHTVGILLIGMALGIAMLYLTNFIVSKANARLNYGQKVRFEGEVIGHISVCRYHGVKKYFFTTKGFGPLNPTSLNVKMQYRLVAKRISIRCSKNKLNVLSKRQFQE
jgi:hypothetical protein